MPRKSKQKQKQMERSPRPPPFQANFRVKHRFRFAATGSSTFSIHRSQLLSLLGIGSGSTSIYRLFSSVKLNRVEVWAVAGTGASDYALANVSLNWLSTLGPNTEVSASGNAINTAHFATSPPRSSLASFWSLSGNNETELLFNVTVPTTAIIDVWIDAILNDGPGTTVTTSNSTTANNLYFNCLDGTTGSLQPVSSLQFPEICISNVLCDRSN